MCQNSTYQSVSGTSDFFPIFSEKTPQLPSSAQIISERKVSRQVRRVLVAQAKRLAWLAEERAKAFAHVTDDGDED